MRSARAGPALPLAVTLQQLSARAPTGSRAATSLAALAALLWLLCLLSVGLPAGSSVLPLLAPTPPAAAPATMTLTLTGGGGASSAGGSWSAAPAMEPWAGPVAWGWLFLARLARRRRAAAAGRRASPGSSNSSSSTGRAAPALAPPAGCPWAGSLLQLPASPASSGGEVAALLAWAGPPGAEEGEEPLPWAFSGGLGLVEPPAEPQPGADALEPLPSLGPLAWLLSEASGLRPTEPRPMELLLTGPLLSDPLLPPPPTASAPMARACTPSAPSSAASPLLPAWPDWAGLPPACTPMAAGPAPGSPGGSRRRRARRARAARAPAPTPTSSGCLPSSRSSGPTRRMPPPPPPPLLPPLPSPAAAPAGQAAAASSPTRPLAATAPRAAPAARPASARPTPPGSAARRASPGSAAATAAATSGSCSPHHDASCGAKAARNLQFNPLRLPHAGAGWRAGARRYARTPLADALAPLGAALLVAQAFAEQRLASPLAPSKVVVTEG